MKKGFTLIEILAVIIVLGIIGLIVFPTVSELIKKSRENLYNDQLEEIKLASEKWAYKNIDKLPNKENESVTITLLELKKNGLLPLDIRDPRDNNLLSNGLSIVITYKSNDYEYSIEENITNKEITQDSPSLILNGTAILYVEINSDYEEKGAFVSSNSNLNDDIVITYYDNGKEVAKIDTSMLKTYTVEYSVTDKDKNLTTVITRTVIIRDTEAPLIELPDKITINLEEANNYDLKKDVLISDNSNNNPTVEINGFDTSSGEKIVKYKACDNSNNCNTKNRIIVVE